MKFDAFAEQTRLREFILRHGYAMVLKPGVKVFADGAVLTTGEWDGNVYNEPPPDPVARARIRRDFHAAFLTMAERDFRRLQAALLGYRDEFNRLITFDWPADNRYGEPQPDGLAALKHLRRIVEHHRAELAAIDVVLAATPEAVAARERAERQALLEAQARERQAALKREAEAIVI